VILAVPKETLVATQLLISAVIATSEGAEKTTGDLVTVIVAVDELVKPSASVAVRVTILAPTSAHEKVLFERLKVGVPQLSVVPSSTK